MRKLKGFGEKKDGPCEAFIGKDTLETRDAFNKAYNKYFTGKHSDEIYQEVTFNK